MSKAIGERIEYLQGDLRRLQEEASKTEAGELSQFCIEWATKKHYELMTEPVKGVIMRLKKYQEDVENEDVPWDLERVKAVAAEFLHHLKADFEAEVNSGLARTEVVLKALAIPNISLFGIPYGEVHQNMQEKLMNLIWRTFLGWGNDDGDGSEDVSGDEEVQTDESE